MVISRTLRSFASSLEAVAGLFPRLASFCWPFVDAVLSGATLLLLAFIGAISSAASSRLAVVGSLASVDVLYRAVQAAAIIPYSVGKRVFAVQFLFLVTMLFLGLDLRVLVVSSFMSVPVSNLVRICSVNFRPSRIDAGTAR